MKRRTFLKTSAAAGTAAVPFFLGGIPVRANSSLEMLAQMPVDNDRILLIIQLFGGNDGLNTVIPVDNDAYYNLRPVIGVPKEMAYQGPGDIYLHPSLADGSQGGIARMLEQGTLSIVQGVGYDNPNLSHFRSTDIWLSGINNSDPNVRLDTGWIGRFLETRYPDFPASLPDHPLAVQFGGFSLTLISSRGRMGIEVTDPTLQKGVESQVDELDPDSAGTAYLNEYEFIADIAERSNKYALAVKDAYSNGKSKLKGKYADNSLAQQMGSVAALIAGGLQSKVYIVSMGGFDTHVSQTREDLSGTHPGLLSKLADAVAQFQYDMTNLDVADRVVGMTVSEFGRRPRENGSLGTDHGAASVQFVFGSRVNGGVFGNTPDLDNLNANGDLAYQIDYRTVYAEILTDWFGMTLTEAQQVLDKEDLYPLDVIEAPASAAPGRSAAAAGATVLVNYPNPFTASTTFRFHLEQPGWVRLEITTLEGRRVAVPIDRRLNAGEHRIPFADSLPGGYYLCTLRAGDHVSVRPIHCVK